MKKINKYILEAITRGVQIALDDFENIEPNKSIFDYNDVINSEKNIKHLIELNNEITVDLGLPSGTRWCKYNLGVKLNRLKYALDWYGKYYAWGEIKSKNNYEWETYKYANGSNNTLTKYCNDLGYGYCKYTDDLTKLLPEDDAAYQNMHFYNFKFKMPTKTQFIELLQYTINDWVENYKGIKKLNGWLFKGKNGNELFFPAGGSQSGSCPGGECTQGNYWLLDLSDYSPWCAYYAYFYNFGPNNKNIGMNDIVSRDSGFSIRPVFNKK